MIQLLDRFAENVKRFTDKAALISDNEGSLSFGEFDDMSGRIYGYLKSEGIGREDVVYIHMTRGLGAIVAMLGVLKAGACFTVSEENAPLAMCDFIAADCNAKIVFDDELYASVIKGESLHGYNRADEHDSAYIVYTSGTTDKPKGVLHEYGNYLQAVMSHFYEGSPLFNEDDIFAVLAPLNFVAAIMDIIVMLYYGGGIFLVDREITRNPKEVMDRCNAHNVTCLFMVPSLVKLLKSVPKSIRFFIVGGEPTDGCFEVGVDVYNFLAMSETGFGICVKKCDKSGVGKIIGRPQFDLDIVLLGKDGKKVRDGLIGELCFESPFVRGYLNLPEENARAFRNGLFHTGDEAVLEPSGEYRLCGRLDNMLKINGNRVDPTEVEIICQKVLAVKDLAVKGFTCNGRSFICLYYVSDDNLDIAKCTDELLEYMPYYMIPSFFVRLDAFKLNSNAKKDRKALEMPSANLYRSEFCSPRNLIEEKICSAFERALGIERIGIFDDFLLLGGDSVAAYKIVAYCNIPGVKIQDIYNGHTPCKIASLISERPFVTDADLLSKNFDVLLDEHMLSVKQQEILKIQLEEPSSSAWILSSLDKLKSNVDVDRFKAAVDRVLSHHPVFSTVFMRDDDGRIVQSYNPNICVDTKIIELSKQELTARRKMLIRPFTEYFNTPLYYTVIYKTQEGVYFQWAVHHAIFDGTSLKVFRKDIFTSYNDSDSKLLPDYYYLMLSDAQKDVGDIAGNTDLLNPYTPVKPYCVSNGKQAGDYDFTLDISSDISNSESVKTFGVNTCFTSAIALALLSQSDKDRVKFKWVYNGRDDVYKLNIIGTLYRTLSVDIASYSDMSVWDYFRCVKNSIDDSILVDMQDTTSVEDNEYALCLIFQDNIYDLGEYGTLVDSSEKLNPVDDGAYTPFDVEIFAIEGVYHVAIHYNRSVFAPDVVLQFADLFKKCVAAVLSPAIDTEESLYNLFERINTMDGAPYNE